MIAGSLRSIRPLRSSEEPTLITQRDGDGYHGTVARSIVEGRGYADSAALEGSGHIR